MSSTSTVITQELLDYVAAHARGDDAFLVELKRAALDEGLPAIWIAPEQAAFMEVLLRVAGASEVVEVGTLAGYSAIRMARVLPRGGRVRTIEIDPRHADFAELWIARSDVAERVELLRSSGAEALAAMADGSADAAFVDADKTGYPGYLDALRRVLRPGGLLMVDNAFGFGTILEGETPEDSASVTALRRFNDHLAAARDFEAIIVPLGDGLWVGAQL